MIETTLGEDLAREVPSLATVLFRGLPAPSRVILYLQRHTRYPFTARWIEGSPQKRDERASNPKPPILWLAVSIKLS